MSRARSSDAYEGGAETFSAAHDRIQVDPRHKIRFLLLMRKASRKLIETTSEIYAF